MLLAYGLVGIVLAVYCVLDVLTSPRSAVRTLPRPVWVVVVLLPWFGPAAWFLAGRPRKADRAAATKAGPPPVPVAPDDDEDFLRELRRRADEQRRRARDPRDD